MLINKSDIKITNKKAKSRLYICTKPWINTTKRSNTPKEREGQAHNCIQSSTLHCCKQERKQYHHRVTTASAVQYRHNTNHVKKLQTSTTDHVSIMERKWIKRPTNPNLNTSMRAQLPLPTLKLRVHKESNQNPWFKMDVRAGGYFWEWMLLVRSWHVMCL